MSIPVAIVEDEPWVRRLLISEIAWKRLGLFLVVEAEDGPQALRLCRLRKPRIVFTDIRLPGFDGLELIERLGSESRDSRFIVVTGHADFAYAQRAMRLGVKDYLLKPVRADEIHLILERMIAEIEREEDARRVVRKRSGRTRRSRRCFGKKSVDRWPQTSCRRPADLQRPLAFLGREWLNR